MMGDHQNKSVAAIFAGVSQPLCTSTTAACQMQNPVYQLPYPDNSVKKVQPPPPANVWIGPVEDAFQEALNLFPVSQGRQKVKCERDGKFYGRSIDCKMNLYSHVSGRNELISRYIYEKTGELRTRKQVSSLWSSADSFLSCSHSGFISHTSNGQEIKDSWRNGIYFNFVSIIFLSNHNSG